MTAVSIQQWVHDHTEKETMNIIRGGEEIYFWFEKLSTADPLILTVIHATYLYYAVEEDRREDLLHMAELKRLEKPKGLKRAGGAA